MGPNSIYGGQDIDGCKIFIGRAFHEGCCLPAKIIPDRKQCFVGELNKISYAYHNRFIKHRFQISAWFGAEIFKEEFEVLVGDPKRLSWVDVSNGEIPAGAVYTGYEGAEKIFIGLGRYENSLTIGKVREKL